MGMFALIEENYPNLLNDEGEVGFREMASRQLWMKNYMPLKCGAQKEKSMVFSPSYVEHTTCVFDP